MAHLPQVIQSILGRSGFRTEYSELMRSIEWRDEANVAAVLSGPHARHLVTMRDEHGRLVLGQAVTALRNRPDIINMILDNGGKVNKRGSRGETALIKAVVAGDVEYVRLLLRRGADPNKNNAAKISPLEIAVRNNATEIALALLEHGASAHTPGILQEAVAQDNLPVTDRLLAAGSRTPGALLEAVEQNNLPVFDRLLAAGAYTPEVMLKAVGKDNHPMVDRLLASGASAATRGDDGATTVHRAAANGSPAMLAKLLALPGVSRLVNEEYKLRAGTTPLQMIRCECYMRGEEGESEGDDAEYCHHTRTAKLLLDAGAYPNYCKPCTLMASTTPSLTLRCVWFQGALRTACAELPCLPMARLLVRYGAALTSTAAGDRAATTVATAPAANVAGCVLDVHGRRKPSPQAEAVLRYIMQVAFQQEPEHVITAVFERAFEYAVIHGVVDIVEQILHYRDDMNAWSAAVWRDERSVLNVCPSKTFLYFLHRGADPNGGLLASYAQFMSLPEERQTRHHSRYRFTLAPLNRLIYNYSPENRLREAGVRAEVLCKINALLYYGASPRLPGVYYTPLHALFEYFGSMSEDIVPTVQLMVLSGLEMGAEGWLVERLQPGVPLARPPLRQWLIANVRQPMPLLHRCIVVLRTLLAPRTHSIAPSLPLPKPLQDLLCLRHIFQPPLVDCNGDVIPAQPKG